MRLLAIFGLTWVSILGTLLYFFFEAVICATMWSLDLNEVWNVFEYFMLRLQDALCGLIIYHLLSIFQYEITITPFDHLTCLRRLDLTI